MKQLTMSPMMLDETREEQEGGLEAKMAGSPEVESCTALCFCLVVGLTAKWTDPDAVTQLGNRTMNEEDRHRRLEARGRLRGSMRSLRMVHEHRKASLYLNHVAFHDDNLKHQGLPVGLTAASRPPSPLYSWHQTRGWED